jgi:hypothetical protein
MHVRRTLLCASLASATAAGCFSSSEPPGATATDASPGAAPEGGEPADATSGSEGGTAPDATVGVDAGAQGEAGGGPDASSSVDSGCAGDGGPGTFSCTGSLTTPRGAPGGAVLADGKVLVAGGWNNTSQTLSSAELYDPASGTFTTTGAMTAEHLWAGWASPWPVLADGKVLAAGGLSAAGALLATAELYDPAAGTFSATGGLVTAVVAFNAMALQGGKVLLVGGYDAVTGAAPTPAFSYTGGTNQAQRYDPASGMFSSAGTLAEARLFGCNVPLPSGKVLAVGGWQGVPTAAESNIEQYDPTMNSWSTVGALGSGVTCNANAFLLPNGSVLLDTSNLLDPGALTTTPTTNALAIANATFVQLANGDVLAFGGKESNVLTVDVQVYRNATGLWTAVGPLHQPRQGSRGFLLRSGEVLVVGGSDPSGTALAAAEIYHP